jgi:HEAT repeat protein
MGIFQPNIGKLEKKGDIQRLVEALGHGNCVVRERAALSLDRLGWKPRDDTEKARYLMAKKGWDDLAELGELAVEPLILGLKDRNEDVVRHAGIVLERVALTQPVAAVEPLIQALKVRHVRVRFAAAAALGSIGDARAVEPLVRALMDGFPDLAHADYTFERSGGELAAVKPRIAEALGQIGEPAVEPLIDTLKERTYDVRVHTALACIGEPTVEGLIRALQDEHPRVRSGAQGALGEIGHASAIAPLVKVLRDTSNRGWTTAHALDQLGWNPPNRVEKAYYLLAQLSLYSAQATAEVFNELVGLGEPAVRPLIHALTDDRYVRVREEGGPVTSFASLLTQAARPTQVYVRTLAAAALVQIGGPAVEPLIQALKDRNSTIRTIAAGALGMIGDARAADHLGGHWRMKRSEFGAQRVRP